MAGNGDSESFDSAYFNMTANDTLTCAARNIQGPVELPFTPLLPLIARCLLTIYFMMVAYFGTILNCFVFYLVCRYKQLRSKAFIFAIQIVAINIFGSVFLMPLAFSSVLANQWLLGEAMCIAVGALSIGSFILRAILFVGLVTDRFCCIKLPYSYPRHQHKVLCSISVVAYFSTAFILILLGVFDCFSFSITTWICRIMSDCNSKCTAFRQFIGIAIFIPFSIVPVVMYAILFSKGRQVRRSIQQLEASVSGNSEANTVKEWRATITFFLMFLSTFIVIVPPGIINLAITLTGITSDSVHSVWFYVMDTITLNVFTLTYITDPIFILRDKDVREVISDMVWIPTRR